MTRLLTLLRHTKASRDDHSLADEDRPLDQRGRADAPALGRAVRAEGHSFDLVLCSPAVRTVETLRGFASGYGADLRASQDKRIYLASPATLLDLIRETDDAVTSLLVIGHNPGIERLALLLGRRGKGAWDQVARKYPTGGLAEIALPIMSWSDAAEGVGTIMRFIKPRDLRGGS